MQNFTIKLLYRSLFRCLIYAYKTYSWPQVFSYKNGQRCPHAGQPKFGTYHSCELSCDCYRIRRTMF